MAQYEITYFQDFRAFGRTIQAGSWDAAESACGEGEFVSGEVFGVFIESDDLVANMRKRIGEAVQEVANA